MRTYVDANDLVGWTKLDLVERSKLVLAAVVSNVFLNIVLFN